MERTIKIGENELRLRSSLYSIISYRSVFGSELFDDIKKLDNKNKDGADSSVIDLIFRIIYIFNKPFTKETYEQFLSNYDFSILSDEHQLAEITNTITDLLGTVKKAPTATSHP